MYKALIKIGGYMPGQEVPEEKAIVWLEMYKEAPVEKVNDESSEEQIEEVPKKNDSMHDDYLNRNADVVKKAIKEDLIEKDVLESLLKIESENKRRKPVIKLLKIKLKAL